MGEDTKRVNPLMEEGLVLGHPSAGVGETILVWRPGVEGSRRVYKILREADVDADGSLVMIVQDEDGKVRPVATSSLGLTCQRHSEDWTHVAVPDDTEEIPTAES